MPNTANPLAQLSVTFRLGWEPSCWPPHVYTILLKLDGAEYALGRSQAKALATALLATLDEIEAYEARES